MIITTILNVAMWSICCLLFAAVVICVKEIPDANEE